MYSHPVYSMHLDISPSGLLILFLPALYSVSVRSYTPFLSAHILCFSRLYTPFLSAHILGFPTLQPISLYGNAPFACISKSIIHPSLFHFPHILSPLLSPSVAARHFFFRVLPYRFHCALPSSFLPFSPLPRLVINRVLLPIPVLVGRLKAQ